MFHCNVPLNMQFEVTYKCNNNCIFCYNQKQTERSEELDTNSAKKIISNIKESGVLSLNFNGGEPLIRKDFLELAEYAASIGLDIHLNTNASLIDDEYASKLVNYFPSVCTTILSGKKFVHDFLSGRDGAFIDAINGIKSLQKSNIYVAVNIMLCNKNFDDITETLDLLCDLKIRTLLITRYVPDINHANGLAISDEDYFATLQKVYNYNKENQCFDRVSLPQPVKVCSVPKAIKDITLEWNIPCNIGLCTGSVNAYGNLTPCNLVKEPIIGNLNFISLSKAWNSFDGLDYCLNSHLLNECRTCKDIQFCGGGCKGYNMSLVKEK